MIAIIKVKSYYVLEEVENTVMPGIVGLACRSMYICSQGEMGRFEWRTRFGQCVMSIGRGFMGGYSMINLNTSTIKCTDSVHICMCVLTIPVGSMTAFPLTRPKSPILRDSSLPRAKKMFDGLRSR